ncbi:hypothetical protein CU633_20530 [Bacillus sp. V3-13]|uniref:hypothetical protein n=1 Tax=Bacillus sp. V3-13 TaxID=2053728 RepID=UPI000C78B522|nr:hypothetical protein [Bacillus sp. V3-13]PLR75567.1 hypothetical protein CU633_20530 [Bacillus sp. V3-13]
MTDKVSYKETTISYQVLKQSDGSLIKDAAACLAETFTGVKLGDSIIREPMCYTRHILKDDFENFVLDYLNHVVEQGYCFIATDDKTGMVIGVYACEIFDPAETEAPVFEGSFEPFNRIMELLGDLDSRFIETLEQRLGRQPERDEYLHAFMLGVRTERDRKLIANRLIQMSLDKAEMNGFKGCFLEATSFKSQVLLTKYFDFYMPVDTVNMPIQTIYAETSVFKTIPAEVGNSCQILYKPLNGTDKI